MSRLKLRNTVSRPSQSVVGFLQCNSDFQAASFSSPPSPLRYKVDRGKASPESADHSESEQRTSHHLQEALIKSAIRPDDLEAKTQKLHPATLRYCSGMPSQPPLPSSGRRRRQWSAELCKADHRELQATAMGMDCNGSLALLAGRRHSALVQLHWDNPNNLGENRPVLASLP